MKIRTFLTLSILACIFCSCVNDKETSKEHIQTSQQVEIESITGVARIEPEKGLLSIYANSSGRIDRIVALENLQITKGSPLMILDNTVEKALFDVEQAKVASQNEAIEVAHYNAQSIKNDLDKAKDNFALNEQLFEAKGITEKALNDSRANLEKSTNDYAKALANLKEQLSKKNETIANINYRRALLEEKVLNAAFTGHVLQWDVHNGDYVTSGQKLGQFAPDGALVAATEIDELFQNKVKVGMKADVYSQLDGKCIATGIVVYVADFLKRKSLFSDENTVEDRRVKEVKIQLDNKSESVINSKVDCTIHLK